VTEVRSSVGLTAFARKRLRACLPSHAPGSGLGYSTIMPNGSCVTRPRSGASSSRPNARASGEISDDEFVHAQAQAIDRLR
jgi:replicative DNA helicase